MVERRVGQLGAERVGDMGRRALRGIIAFGQHAVFLLHAVPGTGVGFTDRASAALREQPAIEGRELVLLPVDPLARFEVDVDEPEPPAELRLLKFQDAAVQARYIRRQSRSPSSCQPSHKYS